ncbi:hypothetical protein [Oligoflexus tunisiensis]|uniref:hypothetical protein n=1 Tax=Oligoflexus tunisiensis TaxID=708132 RepID=UPI00114CBDEF|nr:hypothetical protein [Oligoflexus tunisiensis]
MGSSLKWIGLLLIVGCLQAATRSTLSLREARTYSFMIRDHGPSPDEVMALQHGRVSWSELLQGWLTSEAHQLRMERYFDDMMGFRDQLNVLPQNARLSKSADGVYFAPGKGGCPKAEAVRAEAWWLPPGSQALFCPNLMQTDLTVTVEGKAIVCTKPGRQGFLHPACGCGPDRIRCIAGEDAKLLQEEVQREFSARAVQVYQSDQTWLDLLAAPRFLGTRRLYWLYVQSLAQTNPQIYTDELLQTLRGLPLDAAVTLDFPEGAERAGIATAPGFLVQYNNFRSRIAGLTRSFLCQDVNPTLNTDGIQTFVNPSLKKVDRAHAEKADCSSCHYALDNLGGAVMPWTDRGVYQPKISNLAHAFGQEGQGPRFLMQSFVERGPGFEDCMARRAWEDFSGQRWNETPEPVRSTVRSWVASGPRALMHQLIVSTELYQAMTQGTPGTQPDELSAADWEVIRPIVQQSCSGTSCHSRGTRQPAYAELPSLWVTDRDKLVDRLQRTDAGQMPPRSRPLSNEDRAILLQKIL